MNTTQLMGIERRALRTLSGIAEDGLAGLEPFINNHIVAAGRLAPGSDRNAVEVAFSCAHGLGMFSVPTTEWQRAIGSPDIEALVLEGVRADHRRRHVVTDRYEFFKAVVV